jgi:hypothetical protein
MQNELAFPKAIAFAIALDARLFAMAIFRIYI